MVEENCQVCGKPLIPALRQKGCDCVGIEEPTEAVEEEVVEEAPAEKPVEKPKKKASPKKKAAKKA